MKKNVLALSITAALIGLTGGAHAMTGDLGGATGSTSTLVFNEDGIGQMLLVPYFTAQGNNKTLINITNTDTVNGKAVKVRFRGAANSDDIYDFQVFLSPGDVFAGEVSKGAANKAVMTTKDASCTKPVIKSVDDAVDNLTNRTFVTSRLDQTMASDMLASGTREGYVEIFNMADIPPKAAATTGSVADGVGGTYTTAGIGASANPLYTAIKHVVKVAPCSGTAWTYLDENNLQWNTSGAVDNARTNGLLPPSTGLMANWTIIDVVNGAAWAGEAAAIQVMAGDALQYGNVVYWPQTAVGVGAADVNKYTSDPLLRSTDGTADGVVIAAYYDMPDLSTPYATSYPTTVAGSYAQGQALTASIAASSVTNEFLSDSSIGASNDWVFSMPTRRYSVSLDYSTTLGDRVYSTDGTALSTEATGGALPIVRTNATETGVGPASEYFNHSNTLVRTSALTFGNGRQICVTKAAMRAFPYDREETMPATSGPAVVISPSTPATIATPTFCGEAAVLSMNNGAPSSTTTTGALKASVAVNDVDTSSVGQAHGWLRINTPGAETTGLPMLGSSYVRASLGAQGFGATWAHRLGR